MYSDSDEIEGTAQPGFRTFAYPAISPSVHVEIVSNNEMGVKVEGRFKFADGEGRGDLPPGVNS